MADMYLSIIPIGDANWCKTAYDIAMSVRLNDRAYKCKEFLDDVSLTQRLYDDPKELQHEVMFMPMEAIRVDKGKFRVIVNYSIRDLDIMVDTAWTDEKIKYNDACWIAAEKIIMNHSLYTVIIPDFNDTDRKTVDEVINICKKNNKPYYVLSKDEDVNYDKLYEIFIGENNGLSELAASEYKM